MTRLGFVLGVLGLAAALAGGLPTWRAEAAPLAQAADSLAVLRGHSPVQQVGCMFGTTRCPAGTKWQCTKTPAEAGVVKKCKCRAC
jgi:hypothetical protein